MAAPGTGRERRRQGRQYLGRTSRIGERLRVYRTRDALEIEEAEGYEITRRRVFFDEVLMVTYHRAFGRGYVVLASLLSVFFGGMALLAGSSGGWVVGLTVFSISGLPFLVLLVLRLWLRLDVVTVFGRRTKARLHFLVRKRRARAIFGQICRAARQAQDQARLTATRPAEGPEPPPVAP